MYKKSKEIRSLTCSLKIMNIENTKNISVLYRICLFRTGIEIKVQLTGFLKLRTLLKIFFCYINIIYDKNVC